MEIKPQPAEIKETKKLACPIPKRNFNVEHFGFMKFEGVKFFSENIHMHNRHKNKRIASFRPKNSDKKKRRMQLMKERSAKFGIKFKIKGGDEVVDSSKKEIKGINEIKEIKEVKEEPQEEKEKEMKDTKESSSKGQNSKEGLGNDNINGEEEELPEIDRCSNPMSHLLEENPGFEYDGSITEEDSDDLNDSFGF